MKYALILALAAFSANAQAGFLSCTSETGLVFVGGLDGEANVTDLRVIEANASPAKESALVLEEISLMKAFKLVAKIELPEESVVYTINAKKMNGVSEATITEQAGESEIKLSGTCTIFFKAAN
jgi:hypothetical protein